MQQKFQRLLPLKNSAECSEVFADCPTTFTQSEASSLRADVEEKTDAAHTAPTACDTVLMLRPAGWRDKIPKVKIAKVKLANAKIAKPKIAKAKRANVKYTNTKNSQSDTITLVIMSRWLLWHWLLCHVGYFDIG